MEDIVGSKRHEARTFAQAAALKAERWSVAVGIVFNTSLDAYRDLFAGEYTCCIQESLGKACYTQQLQIRDRPKQFGVDLSDADILYANTGNSYDIRLSSGSEHTEVLCLLNNQTILSNVLHLSHKNKKGKYYHIRIKHFSKENVGEYDCTLRRDGKDVLMKTFVATLESEPAVSFSTNLGCFVLLLLTVVHD
ncbi:hypothetical protein RB195_010609 [Necator americanus]|uniref:Uncharacterized protein n=1 Tax=Necator americanus TaxID=51031 RepID=A0ABR1CYU2_NECAM